MKLFLLLALQFLLFLAAIAVGSFWRPFGLERIVSHIGFTTRVFVWDGILLALALCLLLAGAELLRRRTRILALWTGCVFLLAVAASLLMKFGFITREL